MKADFLQLNLIYLPFYFPILKIQNGAPFSPLSRAQMTTPEFALGPRNYNSWPISGAAVGFVSEKGAISPSTIGGQKRIRTTPFNKDVLVKQHERSTNICEIGNHLATNGLHWHPLTSIDIHWHLQHHPKKSYFKPNQPPHLQHIRSTSDNGTRKVSCLASLMRLAVNQTWNHWIQNHWSRSQCGSQCERPLVWSCVHGTWNSSNRRWFEVAKKKGPLVV